MTSIRTSWLGMARPSTIVRTALRSIRTTEGAMRRARQLLESFIATTDNSRSLQCTVYCRPCLRKQPRERRHRGVDGGETPREQIRPRRVASNAASANQSRARKLPPDNIIVSAVAGVTPLTAAHQSHFRRQSGQAAIVGVPGMIVSTYPVSTIALK